MSKRNFNISIVISSTLLFGLFASDLTHEQRVDALSQQLYVQGPLNESQENKQSNFFQTLQAHCAAHGTTVQEQISNPTVFLTTAQKQADPSYLGTGYSVQQLVEMNRLANQAKHQW